jgi:hypothetical protein
MALGYEAVYWSAVALDELWPEVTDAASPTRSVPGTGVLGRDRGDVLELSQ